MMTRPIPTPMPNQRMLQFHHRVRLVLLCCSLAGCLAPAASHAQTWEVLRPGFFQAGNRWEFSSISGSLGFATTWEIVAVAGTTSTVILRETARPGAPYYVDDLYVTLDNVAMQMSKLYETQYNPTLHIEVTYTPAPGLPKLPRVVNKTDSNRVLGHANSSGHVVENPTQTWTSVQDQFVTYITTATISVPAGSFSDCVTFRVTENWRYNDGWTGVAWRDFAISRHAGPVKMAYYIWDYRPDGSLYNYSTITHALVRFVPAIPDLVPSQGYFTPIAALAGTTVTVSWHEDSLYQASGAHVSDVYLSTDTVITSRDIRLARKSVQALSAYGGVSLSAAAAIPSGVAGGAYYVAIFTDSLSQITEWNKANNTYLIPGKLNVVAKPDLTPAINSFSPSSMQPGGVLSVSARIRNIGGLSAPLSIARVYLSTDTVINTRDFLLIPGISVPTIAPNSQYTFLRDAFVPSPFPNGAYHVGVMADATKTVSEANENNNTTASAGVVVIGYPDLAVTGGTFTPHTRQAGETITIEATVQNSGVFTAGANSIGIYLSADNHITSGDTQLGPLLSCPALTSGSAITVNAIRVIPMGTSPGTYYVGVIADVANVVVESDESNNARALAGTLVVVPPPYPDLIPSRGSFFPTIVIAGTTVTVNWTETSLYRNAAAHATDVYLSTDTVITSSDIRLTRKNVPAINAGTSVTVSAAALVPGQVAAGPYHVIVIVDALSQVRESNEANNTVTLSGLLTVIGAPDLTVTRVTFSPPLLRPGETINVSGAIRNIGATDARDTVARIYLSADRIITSSDRLVTEFSVSPVPSGVTYPFSRITAVPPSIPNGFYFVGVICDASNLVNEANETNNTGSSTQTALIGLPDLVVVGGSFGPVDIRAGDRITVNATIGNTGPFTAAASSTSIYLSTDSVITRSDILLQSGIRCRELTSGSVFAIHANPIVPRNVAYGLYRVGVICDVNYVVHEANESNNASALPGLLRVNLLLRAKHWQLYD